MNKLLGHLAQESDIDWDEDDESGSVMSDIKVIMTTIAGW